MRRLRSRRPWLALVVTALALGALLPFVGRPSQAQAHPLGNFTINRYSRLELSSDVITLHYVLDLAEIPAFQERDAIDDDGDGQISERERTRYLDEMANKLRDGFGLTVNAAQVELRPLTSDLSFPPGQGGLDTQRVVIDYAARMPGGWERSTQQAAYRDDNYSDRIGWREVIVRGADGVRITDASVPSQDVSTELRSYPDSGLADPLRVSGATFAFELGTSASLSGNATAPAAVSSERARAERGNPDSTLARYAGLIAHDRLSAGVIVLSLLAAMGFGALHALSPGHGKTIVAAYLVGSRGTARHALLLGLTVTATHTSTVYVMGFVTLYLSQYILPEDLYPWLGIASGALILTLGLSLLVGRLRSSGLLGDAVAWLKQRVLPLNRPALATPALATQTAAPLPDRPAPIDHHHDFQRDHAHEATHGHGLGPADSHAMPGQNGERVTWRGLIGLGVFGGLLPCPSAIVVMLSAIALHRVAFGLLLIFAFSVGLAAVLTGIGFALVYARRLSGRLPLLGALQQGVGTSGALSSLAMRAFPAASAAAVVVAGLVVTLRALVQQGVL